MRHKQQASRLGFNLGFRVQGLGVYGFRVYGFRV